MAVENGFRYYLLVVALSWQHEVEPMDTSSRLEWQTKAGSLATDEASQSGARMPQTCLAKAFGKKS